MHQFIIILFICVISNNINAQYLDSVKRNKIQNLDSSFKNQTNATVNDAKHKLDSIKKEQIKLQINQIANQKQAIISKTDSAARRQQLNKGKQQVNQQFQPLKSKLEATKNLKNRPKTFYNNNIKGKKLVLFSAEIRSESYYTTAQNPLMRNEPYYSRLYVSPTLTLMGLPFKGNVFLTTENNNTYKSDFFSFRFDANAYRQMAAKQVQNQINEAKKIDRLRAIDLQKNALETQRFENEFNQLKTQIPNIEAIEQQLKQQAEEKSKSYIEEQEKIAKEQLKTATEEQKQKIENELKYKKDSIVAHYKKQADDSLLNSKDKVRNKIDSAQLDRYLKAQEKLEELKQKKQKLEQLRQADSAKLLQNINQARNPDELKKMAKEQLKGNKLMQQVLSVDRFGFGIVNPQYSENTLFAVSVKGIDIGVNQNNYFYDLTIGKTTPQFLGMFSNQAPQYTRNIGVARIGIGEFKKDHFAVEVLHAFDPNDSKTEINPVKNTILNLTGQYTLYKKTEIQAQIAQSSYKETKDYKVNGSGNAINKFNRSAFQSYQIKAIHTLNENTKAEINVKQTGIGFRTVGNPFLRKNFRELESKIEHQMFKKQIKIQANYKEMRDNLVEIGPSTNRIKGYGLKLSTSFPKYPNLTLSYSPYQQGNNHPDSLYRSNNQFSITSAILTYKKRFKSIQWMGLLSMTRSAMELNGAGVVAYKMYNTMHTFQLGNRQNLILSYMHNTTAPYVDSLNSQSYQVSHTYLLSHKLTISEIAEYSSFKNNAFKAGFGLQLNAQILKKLNIGLLSRYDRVHGIWNLSNTNVFTGRLTAIWRF